jgi:ketosteroid isomerase-like protein
MGKLEENALLLLDYQEIANLKSIYLSNVDGGWGAASHNADVIASLFTRDGIWKSDSFGEVKGRSAIRETFLKFQKVRPFVFHSAATPFIKVEGDLAMGAWHVLMFGTDANGKPIWSAGIYEDMFARTPDEGWRLSQVYGRAIFISDWGRDWVDAMAQQAQLREVQQKGAGIEGGTLLPEIENEAREAAGN